MRVSEIVRIDSRGRVTLPSALREAAGFSEGMYVMLVADMEEKQVRIIPFADPKAKLVEFHLAIPDAPGALAKAASVLAENNVDLLATTSRTLKRGELAEWIVIADVSKCKYPLTKLQEEIRDRKAAEKVEIKEIPT
ncbi:MAG: AbrB family transcriptional regulator [Candidatus Bathyarchaeia archaeon]